VFIFHWSVILLIPGFVLGLWAQHRVSSTFKRWAKVPASTGIAGREMALRILAQSGISNIKVEETGGQLSDHYDPRAHSIRLSKPVYEGKSVASLGVAAHECGHAIQDHSGYAPLKFRWALLKPAGLGSTLGPWFVIIGFFMGQAGGFLIDLGIILFAAAVLFQVVTLPVELNASKRAVVQLQSAGMVAPQDVAGVREVLNAAAFTYVAAAASAILSLLHLVLLSRNR
jgi:Zn-dependent membrane protease YugP